MWQSSRVQIRWGGGATKMRLQVRCACGKTLVLAPKWIGKRIRCPFCKDALTISSGALTQSVAAVVDKPAPSPRPPEPTSPSPPQAEPEVTELEATEPVATEPTEPPPPQADEAADALDLDVELDLTTESVPAPEPPSEPAPEPEPASSPPDADDGALDLDVELDLTAAGQSDAPPEQEEPTPAEHPPPAQPEEPLVQEELEIEVSESAEPSASADAEADDIPPPGPSATDVGDLDIEFVDPSSDDQALDGDLIPDAPAETEDVTEAPGVLSVTEQAEAMSVEGILVDEHRPEHMAAEHKKPEETAESEGDKDETRPCPHCEKPIAADAVFCTECGTDLKTGKKAGATAKKKGLLGKLFRKKK